MTDTSPKFSGEPNAQVLANGLATLGRYGDNYMVHAAEGETVVPKEVLDANPGLKEDLFKQMITMGIKNPDRYVVGNQLNSINPITGQPEFFFKKIFKAVKKVAKKILPVAAPFIGNAIAPGIGGIIASGLTTSLTGGSASDVLKSMALSYGLGALGQGVSGARSPTGTFLGGLSKGFTEPFTALSNLASSGPSNPLAQGIFGPALFGSTPIGSSGGIISGSSGGTLIGSGGSGGATDNLGSRLFPPTGGMSAENLSRLQVRKPLYPTLESQRFSTPFYPTLESQRLSTPLEPTRGGGSTLAYEKIAPSTSSIPSLKKAQEATKEATEKGLLERFGSFITGDKLTGTPASLAGAGALGIGAYLAADALTPDELSVAEQLERLPDSPKRRAYEQWKGIQDKSSPAAQSLKNVWYGTPSYSASQLASMFNANPLSNITEVAGGGEIVGPGTGTSDSIPAMLSDGEFVMTAKAVRNAGNGDRDLGAARMYDMMNRFEKGTA